MDVDDLDCGVFVAKSGGWQFVGLMWAGVNDFSMADGAMVGLLWEGCAQVQPVLKCLSFLIGGGMVDLQGAIYVLNCVIISGFVVGV